MIELVDDYVIEVTKFGYNLLIDKHKLDKKGKHIYQTVGYYGTLTGALNGALKHMNRMRLSEETHSLKEAIQIINHNHKMWYEILERIISEEL